MGQGLKCDGKFGGQIGSTLWEPPIDEEDAKWYNGRNGMCGHQGLVGKVIQDEDTILTMFCGDRTMRFLTKGFRRYPTPDFTWGDEVLVIAKG